MNRTLTCIVCPRGCTLTVTGERDSLTVSGNSCPKGKQYAIDEVTHPVRTVTSTVRISNREDTMVSVKTREPVPKTQLFEVMQQLRRVTAEAPLHIGDVLIPDVCGTDIIATKEIV